MRIFKHLKIILIAIIAFSISSQNAFADINSSIEGTLNGLINAERSNESNKPALADRYQSEEIIDPQSGSLTYKQTDLVLKGKDGLDFSIARLYQSAMSEEGTKRVSVTQTPYQVCSPSTTYYIVIVTWYFPSSTSYLSYSSYAAAAAAQAYYANTDYTTATGPYTQTEPGSCTTSYNTSINNYVDSTSYLRTKYDLGTGWSFAFPSLQIESNSGTTYQYFHDGTGAVYRVDLSLGNSNLVNYQGKDVQFLADSGSYTNGELNSSSAYVFISSDKRRTYFSSDGRLLGIKDRFNNEIKFNYTDRTVGGASHKYISLITDSIGRTISFVYENTIDGASFTKEDITVTVTDPVIATNKVSLKYTKGRDLISGIYYPKLWSVTQAFGAPEAQTSYYDYDLLGAGFRFDTKSISGAAINVLLLKKITNANSATYFAYDPVQRNLGVDGLYQTFRIKSRYDNELRYKNSAWYETGKINEINYAYQNDISGAPAFNNEDALPVEFEFGSELTTAAGMKIKNVFNNKKQLIRTEIVAKNFEKKVSSNLSFDATYTQKPTRIEVSEYNASNILVRKLYVDKSYKDWGGLDKETVPLTLAQINDPTIKPLYTTSYQYDTTYKLITRKDWYQNATTLLSELFDYDSLGRIKTYTNAKGEITNYTYETNTAVGDKVTSTQAVGNGKISKSVKIYGAASKFAFPTETYQYYTNDNNVYTEVKSILEYNLLFGLVSKETDPEQRVTNYLYDMLGRVTSIKVPSYLDQQNNSYEIEQKVNYYANQSSADFDTTNADLTTTKVSSALLVKKKIGTSTTESYFEQKDNYFDGFGNLVARYYFKPKEIPTDTDNWVEELEYHYDSLKRPIYVKDAESNENKLEYDDWGRTRKHIDPLGNVSLSDYDITTNKQTDAFIAAVNANTNPYTDAMKSNVKETYLDQWSRTSQTTQYPDWPLLTNPINQKYTYDFSGNMKSYEDGKGYTTTFNYDQLNRLKDITDPKLHTTRYEYNVQGDLEKVKQTDGSVVWENSKQYDEMDRLSKKIDPLTNFEKYVSSPVGNMLQRTDMNGAVHGFVYDNLNRVSSEQTGTTSFIYDYQSAPFGPAKVEEKLSGVSVRSDAYSYKSSGALDTRTTVNEGYTQLINYNYDLLNRITNVKDSFGTATNYKYTGQRLDKVQTNGSPTVSFTNDSTFAQYSYYADGKVDTITYPKLDDGTYLKTKYLYDKLNRLQSVTNTKGGTELSKFSYTYDNNSNIETVTDNTGLTSYQYDKLNQLENIIRPNGAVIHYTYDERGNRQTLSTEPLAEPKDAEYTFNSYDQLTKSKLDNKETTFQYDTEGLRLKKQSIDKTVRYQYDASGHIIAESDSTNTVKADYVWGSDRLLVKKDKTTPSSPKDYYYLYNGHGDVVQIVDSNGVVKNSYVYDEWGTIVSQVVDPNVENAFKYAGETYDEESGLYYLRTRYYDPSLGTFISKDKFDGNVGNPLTLNGFIYANNNPLSYIDPSGQMSIWQLDDLLKGLAKSVGDALYDIIKTPGALFALAKGLATGSVNFSDMASSLSSSLLEPFVYLANNTKHVIFGHPSNAEVVEYGKQLGNVIQMLLGTEAGVKVLSKALPKLEKMLSKLEKVDACNCFTAGTKVMTDKGEKPIEEIEVGDRVLSKDEITGEEGYKEVTDTFNHVADAIYKIHVSDQVIESTFNHPFWVDGQGWTFVKDLNTGDLLVQSDGNKIKINSIEFEPKQATVYNMTVDEFHTYFVSNLGIWVHNTGGACSLKPSGSYTIEFENGMKYHGKGDLKRANQSAKEKSDKYNNPVKENGIDWTPSANSRQGFIDEYQRMKSDGGYRSSTNYNQRNSPGANYYYQQYGYY